MTEKIGYYADCYILSEKRTSEFIQTFLDKFIPNRHESADEYEIPQYSDEPKVLFRSAVELMDYLSINKNEVHTVYWANNDKGDIKGAMCFFTNDGQVILGLYCDTMYPDTSIEDNVFADLTSFCESSNGYITYEEPTTHNTTEFLERVKSTTA